METHSVKALPLFYYPSHCLWIDDDKLLLKCMTLAFSERNNISPFPSAKACLDFIHQYQSPLSQQNFLISNTQDMNYGILQHTPIDFDVTMLANLANDPERHDEVTVMVVDYHMPEMDGFALAQATQHLPIQKILLTGKAQESDAIAGFNNKLIHRFVQKGTDDMEEQLSRYLKELSLQYFQQLTLPLLSYLEAETRLPLTDPIFIEFFENYCEKYQITEYYLIDKQGSFLCIDHQENRSCLAMQSDDGIASWLTAHWDEKNLPDHEVTLIQNKEKMPFFGVGKEGWQVKRSEWSKHFYVPTVLNGREKYYWARVEM